MFKVYWTDDGDNTCGQEFIVMTVALAFMQELRQRDQRYITMASESADNVGKMGVAAVVDGKCPDGEDFLGRTSRHGMLLKRGR
jgi:hypothetical protein